MQITNKSFVSDTVVIPIEKATAVVISPTGNRKNQEVITNAWGVGLIAACLLTLLSTVYSDGYLLFIVLPFLIAFICAYNFCKHYKLQKCFPHEEYYIYIHTNEKAILFDVIESHFCATDFLKRAQAALSVQ
jgi:hypothetical protein